VRANVEDRLLGRDVEFFEAHASGLAALLLVGSEVFAQQAESWRSAQIDHHHVGGFREVVAGLGGGDIVFREALTIVGHLDRERFGSGLLGSRHKIPAHRLAGQSNGHGDSAAIALARLEDLQR
jgi:hypothetical protein